METLKMPFVVVDVAAKHWPHELERLVHFKAVALKERLHEHVEDKRSRRAG